MCKKILLLVIVLISERFVDRLNFKTLIQLPYIHIIRIAHNLPKPIRNIGHCSD
jgi:hypothetical protein